MKLASNLPSYVRKTIEYEIGDTFGISDILKTNPKQVKSSCKKYTRKYSQSSIENSVSHSDKSSSKMMMSKTHSKGYNRRISYDTDNEIYISDNRMRYHHSKPRNKIDKRFSSKLPCNLGVSKKYI